MKRDTSADLDVEPTCSVSGRHNTAGTYPIVCSGGSDPNYTFSYVNGTLTVNAFNSNIDIYIGGDLKGSHVLAPNESTRQSYAGVNNGPVKVTSTNGIRLIAAERVIYNVNGIKTSFSEMMGLPETQLATEPWLPWYNNVDLDTRLGSLASICVMDELIFRIY